MPQLLVRRAADFLWAAGELAAMGYPEINLNLGCPSGTVVAKGKGSGFLGLPEELERFFDEVFAAVKLPVSVKTRLGVKEPEEFERLLDIYNRYPIACLTITPGCRSSSTRGPCTGTGSPGRRSAAGIPVLQRGSGDRGGLHSLCGGLPAIDAVMIGRGAIADPACCGSSGAASPPPGRSSRPSPGRCISPTRTSMARWARRPSG